MRHVWQSLFNECCKMTWDKDKKSWEVEWGFMQTQGKAKELIHTGDINYDAALFEPIKDSGTVPNQI